MFLPQQPLPRADLSPVVAKLGLKGKEIARPQRQARPLFCCFSDEHPSAVKVRAKSASPALATS